MFPLLFFIALSAWCCLVVEARRIRRAREQIPLRITVTGTRGKSTIVRLLAAVLREAGIRTLARTTGSEALILYPDGREEPVSRHHLPTIMEQKRFLKKASNLGVSCIVAEIMSIHPENHWIESRRILKPHRVIISNIRPDHIDALGDTPENQCAAYLLDVPSDSAVYLPHSRAGAEPLLESLKKENIPLHPCPPVSAPPGFPHPENWFGDNGGLVFRLCRHLGISASVVNRGMVACNEDPGAFRIHSLPSRNLYFASGFSANEPESSMKLLERAEKRMAGKNHRNWGILALRRDRADRTLQWIRYLRSHPGRFHRLYVTGDHFPVFRRKIPGALFLDPRSLHRIFSSLPSMKTPTLVFGFGNFHPRGRRIQLFFQNLEKRHAS